MLTGHRDAVILVQFSDDGTQVVSRSVDNTVRCYSEILSRLLLPNLSLFFFPKPFQIFPRTPFKVNTCPRLTTSADLVIRKVRFWDVASGDEVRQVDAIS